MIEDDGLEKKEDDLPAKKKNHYNQAAIGNGNGSWSSLHFFDITRGALQLEVSTENPWGNSFQDTCHCQRLAGRMGLQNSAWVYSAGFKLVNDSKITYSLVII